jgi:DNA-binding transcriptional regulator YdaS (Cro superfamily)
MLNQAQRKRLRKAFNNVDRNLLAKKLRVARNYIDQIAMGHKQVSPSRAIIIEGLTENKLTAELLRPDIFFPRF